MVLMISFLAGCTGKKKGQDAQVESETDTITVADTGYTLTSSI